MKAEPFIIERTFDAPANKVWQAITDKDKMKQWYFDLPQFRPEVGCRFEFYGGPAPDRQYKHLSEVVEVIPQHKIAYTWRYEGYEGNTTVTFEVLPAGDKTTVRLTHEGLETFPADNPDFASQNFAAGWTALIGTSLKEYLDKAENEAT